MAKMVRKELVIGVLILISLFSIIPILYAQDSSAPLINFTSPTPDNASTQYSTSIFINVSSSDDSNISTFIDFDNSLLGWWRMDDINGSMVIDYTGKNNGTAYGPANQTNSGKLGKGFLFNNTGNITFSSAILPVGSNILTWGGWVKWGSIGTGSDGIDAILSQDDGSAGGYAIFTDVSGVYCYDGNDITNAPYSVSLDTWYHVMCVHDGAEMTLFVDSQERDATPASKLVNNFPFSMGIDNGIYQFNGSIDDVMIFNRNLSSEEISALYANSSSKYLTQNFINLALGVHIFKAYSQDTAGNINTTETRSVTIDIPPTVTINSPTAGQAFTTASVLFNVTLNKNGACLVSTDSGVVNHTMSSTDNRNFNYTNYSMLDGSYTAKFYCNDTSNNVNNTEQVVFGIDTTYPQINITYPINTTYISVSALNYTFTETNPSACWWSNSSGAWNSTPVTCGTNWTELTSNEGSNTWTVYINDSAGNINSSSVTFTKDVFIAINSPTSGQAFTTASVLFNVTLNENGTCLFSLNAGALNYTMSSTDNRNFNYTNSSMLDGSYTAKFYCNDSVGNKNNTMNVSFTIDTTYPQINITYPQNITYNTNVNALNYTRSDTNLAGCWYSLNGGANSSYNTSCSNWTGLTSNEGSNTWTVYINDSVGNINSSSVTFTKDVFIVINSPVSGQCFTTSSVLFNVTLNENGTCLFSLNAGALNYTMSSTDNRNFNYTNSSMLDGSYTTIFYCNNTAGNRNDTMSVSFSVDTTNKNSESASEWWMFMKYLNHTAWDGVSFAKISGLNSATYTTGDDIRSSPAVANGYVYVGSNDNNLYQLNATNISQQIANYTTGDDIRFSPAVANGYVYVGSRDNTIYQLNASNISQQIANYTTGGDIDSSPAVANGYVYVGSVWKLFFQLNASNISQQIANYTPSGALFPVFSSPAVANGFVYFGNIDNNLYQLNASNISQQIANYSTGGQVSSSPAVANGYVYVGSYDNNLYQLNASDVSQLIATYTTGGDVYSSPAVADGYVYVGSLDNKLYQLNATNISQQIANYTTGDDILSSPAVANGYVYIGSYDNKLYQLNASNVSQQIGDYVIGGDIYSSPAVANGYVYVGSNDNKLYQLDADNFRSIIQSVTTSPVNNETLAKTALINFNISIDEILNWCGLSIDGGANITMTLDSSKQTASYSNDYLVLDYGNHNATFSCNYTGNYFYSTSVNFSINSSITTFPVNNGHFQRGKLINFDIYINQILNWCGLSIDGGSNITMDLGSSNLTASYSNVSLDLNYGNHNATFSCNYTNNSYSTSVNFSISHRSIEYHQSAVIYIDDSGNIAAFGKNNFTLSFWYQSLTDMASYYTRPAGYLALEVCGGEVINCPQLTILQWTVYNDTSNLTNLIKYTAYMRNGATSLQIDWYEYDPYDTRPHLLVMSVERNSADGFKLYYDGRLVNSTDPRVFNGTDFNASEIPPIEYDNYLGGILINEGDLGPAVNPRLDEVRVYNGVALNSTQILDMFNNRLGKTISESEFASIATTGAYMEFDETDMSALSVRKLVGGNWFNGLSRTYLPANLVSVDGGLPYGNPDSLFTIISPITGQTSQIVDFNISSNDTLSWCGLSLDGSANITMTLNSSLTGAGYTNSTMTEGSHTIVFSCNDTDNNFNSSSTSFIVDAIKPLISIVSPSDNTNSSNIRLNVNYSVSGQQACWYSNDTYSENLTLEDCDNITTVTWAEGQHNVTVWANDSAGNVNSSFVSFTIDTVFPVISVSSPLNQTYNTNQILINFTADNYESLWYYNGTDNRSYASEETITADEGSNEFIFYANDSAGNLNLTSITFFVDSVYPVISIAYPANTTYNTNVSVLNYTRSDANFVGCWYSLNGGVNSSYNTTCSNFTGLTSIEGSNTWIVYINDSAGNLNSSSVTFFKDSIAPAIGLISPADSASSTSTTQTFSFNVTDNSIVNCSLILDGSITNFNSSVNISLGINFFTNTTAIGSHSWSINCTDSANNKANSSTRTFTIDTSTPPDDGNHHGGGGGGGGILNRTYNISESQLKNGYTNLFAKSDLIKFRSNNEGHQLKVDNIDSKKRTVTLTISSEKQTKTLLLGEEWKVNLNRDNYYDIYIKLNNITNSKANLTIKSIYELIPGGKHDEKKDEKPGDTTTKKNDINEKPDSRLFAEKGFIQSYWIYLLLAIFFLIIILTIMKIKLLFLYSINEKEWYFIEKK